MLFRIPSFKKNYFLGIDFGTSSIKVVELVFKNSGIHLSNYGWAKFPVAKESTRTAGFLQSDKDERISKTLQKLLKKMDINANSAHISMGGFRGLSALIKITDMGENLDEIVKAEANKYIPVSLDEVYLSWDIISKVDPKDKNSLFDSGKHSYNLNRDRKKKETEILLVAAPKDDVRKYEKIVSEAGIKVDSLELDIFSEKRALIGNDLGSYLIIDMGAKITNLIFSKKGVIRANRNINIGGNEITKNIMSNLNVSWDRAETFKRKNDYLSKEGRNMMIPVVDTIAKEAGRIIELNVEKGKNVDEIIVTGGGSGIVGIEKMFSELLNVKTEIGNPWHNVIIENNIIKEKTTDLSGKLSVAIGLALKGAEDYKRT